MELYRHATELVIRILEQNKHGQISRFAKARADLVATRAQQEALNVRGMMGKARGLVYDGETREALRNYLGHLRDARGRMRQRKRDVEKELWGYGVGRSEEGGGRDGRGGEDQREGKGRKEVVMREIARVYAGLGKEVEEVRRDLKRLEGR